MGMRRRRSYQSSQKMLSKKLMEMIKRKKLEKQMMIVMR